ncbi:MAG: alpha-amylase family glycosyl hydrolase [Burkholderiales bacterium]
MSASDWWKHGTIYQIYPRSFQDSTGDGIGDLNGIRQRLDYLIDLGIDAVWISPFYPSPMADFGYDISNYCDVDPLFGTLGDFDALAADMHRSGLKVIADYVPNHTSDQHPWFIESKSSRTNPKRDWYLWRNPAADGGPPNNWLSHFGGPAWTFDETTGQFYCHSFLKQQPDLNWRNPEVRAAMYDVMRFWLRRGVDGFRIDVLYCVIKDDQFRDNPPNPMWQEGGNSAHRLLPKYTSDRPEVQQIVREMRKVTDEFSSADSDRILIGELHLPLDRLMAYYGREPDGRFDGVQLPFNFQLIRTPWNARAIDQVVRDYEGTLPPGAAPNWVLGNHDESRIATRAGGVDQARLAAMLLLTLRGTPTLYYGDEIGMTDVAIAAGEVQDPREKNEPGKDLGRDPERTPMQWSDEHGAGFTRGDPWLKFGADWKERNVAALMQDESSILALYRRLLALRRAEPALHRGAWEPIDAGGQLLAYARVDGARRLVVLLNFGKTAVEVGRLIAPDRLPADPVVLLSTRLDADPAEAEKARANRAIAGQAEANQGGAIPGRAAPSDADRDGSSLKRANWGEADRLKLRPFEGKIVVSARQI